MTSKIYYHKPLAPDTLLGRVTPDGRVFQSRPGPDRLIGRVDLDSGRIYESRLGPDRYVGRVALDSGRVQRHKPMAPDAYLGRVDSDGQFFRHRPLARDSYIGKAVPMIGYAHAGAAMLLLALPAWEAENAPSRKATAESGR